MRNRLALEPLNVTDSAWAVGAGDAPCARLLSGLSVLDRGRWWHLRGVVTRSWPSASGRGEATRERSTSVRSASRRRVRSRLRFRRACAAAYEERCRDVVPQPGVRAAVGRTVACSSASSRSAARSANASIGTRPAADTRFGSSNTADDRETYGRVAFARCPSSRTESDLQQARFSRYARASRVSVTFTTVRSSTDRS